MATGTTSPGCAGQQPHVGMWGWKVEGTCSQGDLHMIQGGDPLLCSPLASASCVPGPPQPSHLVRRFLSACAWGGGEPTGGACPCSLFPPALGPRDSHRRSLSGLLSSVGYCNKALTGIVYYGPAPCRPHFVHSGQPRGTCRLAVLREGAGATTGTPCP